MAINPLLLNVKPISEITTVDNPTKGHLLFYDGSDELKKVDIIKFQSLIGGIAKPLAIADATPTTAGWYKPTTSGTYANAGGLVAQVGYDTLFYFDGTTWSLVAVDMSISNFKSSFNIQDNTNGSTDKAVFDYLSSISFDGKNMVLSGNYIDTYHDSQFKGWSVYGGATIGTDANGTFANIPARGTAVVYNENLIYPSKPLKFIINVEQTNPDLKLLIDDSNPNLFGLSQVLSAGVNEILFDGTTHTDKTVIIRNYSTTQGAKVRSIKIMEDGIALPNTTIPLNIDVQKNTFLEVIKEVKTFVASDYTNVGATASITSGALNITGTSDFNKRVEMNFSTLHENSDLIFTYKENSASGCFFGFRSQNNFGYNHNIYFCYHTSGNHVGKIEVYAGSSLTSKGISTVQNTNYTVGDILRTTIKRKGLKYTFIVHNLTKGWKIEHTQQLTPLGTPYVAHNEAKPSVISYAGSISILNYKIVSNSQNIDNYIAGDSITFGQSATEEGLRWASLVNGNNLVSGGGADTTINVKNRLAEIKLLKPKRVLLMIGGNDILFSVASATWQQNLRDIRTELVDAGIEVVHLYPTPRSGASTLISFINSEPLFLTDLKIDTNTPLREGTNQNDIQNQYDGGDNLHPNNIGMAKVAEIINNTL